MICCSNCDRVCFDHDYTSYLVSCTMSKKADKTLLIASTLFSLPLVALLIYCCYHLFKKSPCYRPLSCRKPSFKCCDKNSRIRVYLNTTNHMHLMIMKYRTHLKTTKYLMQYDQSTEQHLIMVTTVQYMKSTIRECSHRLHRARIGNFKLNK